MADASVLVGEYGGVLGATLADVPIDGLVRESTYLWGVFRTRAGNPDIFSVMRRLTDRPSWPARLLLQSNQGAPGIRRHETDLVAARSADAVRVERSGDVAFAAAPVDGTQPFELAIGDGSAHWSEGALVDVTGSEVTPGLQWCLPSTTGRDGMRYASRIFRVTGRVAREDVDGFIGCDEVHLAQGRQNYVDDPLTTSHLSEAWCTWATAYDDGSVEAGHAAFGRNGFAFGLRSADGRAVTTNAVSGSVERNEIGCPAHVRFDIGGEAWEFVADGRGFPVDPLPGPVRQAEGWFRRSGETRRPVAWCATPEVPAPVTGSGGVRCGRGPGR